MKNLESTTLMNKIIFIGMVVIFWTSAWDSLEILVTKFLQDYWVENNTNRLIILSSLMFMSLGIIGLYGGLNLVI